MEISVLSAALAAAALAAPFLVHTYIQRLPVAPACPSCRAVTREIHLDWLVLQVLNSIPTLYLGECPRCGWRGRMRWRWAPRTNQRSDGR